ncbi:hypothetical protein BAUCODRAFT_503294 [Baudoinia panamericana UAMH 10762]|uniref:Spindle assembly checkpoint component MAD1 n=1 Tax=Baudoinia panamericana (strain UAMH 10762) TaxID=717646 RepID=M2LN54_BAUPA|nr:uncharacterized protein BAUCODRAFT_503294 [Baudoinia panamericana UAMH 10762]EMC95777.1 hypothetical protein BAUCODRAFT_503294 [Baudoinia panamericana UAMH 10762]
MMARNQPTYDFLSGPDPSPPHQVLRETLKQSTVSRADINNESLRAQLNTLQYELDSIKQERDLTALHHQQEIREALSRSEADFKRAQAAEAASSIAKSKADALVREQQEAQDRATNEKLQLERKIRALQEDNRAVREELEDVQADLSSRDRESQHAYHELGQKYATLRDSVDAIQQDLRGKVSALQSAQQKLAEKEGDVGKLENEVLRLKAQTGDADTLAVVKRELSDQVAYIKKLETTNREQSAELKQFRKVQNSIKVVEEEKRSLEGKVRLMEDLRKQLAESQLQRRILEDEKQGWTSYLDAQMVGEGGVKYDTPEQMARAFLQERLERLSLVDKLGSVQPELTVKDETIRRLEDERVKLQAELERLRSAGNTTGGIGDSRARLRLERQRNLVMKEVEYLRAQMKALEAEETEFGTEPANKEQSDRVSELESLVEQYRNELQTLHVELSRAEMPPPPTPSPRKRTREEDEAEGERLGELQRRARSLQDDLDKLHSRNQLLEAELKASVSQLTSLKESSRTRILELRQNPTADVEALKMSTLNTLREENAALLAQLEGKPNSGSKVVPISTLHATRLQLEELKSTLAQQEKKTLRLKQIWSSKSLEFREAVCSILGWKLDFLPSGRCKVTSVLYPSVIVNGEEEEASIVFDGENGTMKVSGGPQSVFASEIKGLIEFWVEGRKDIPCFLAACTLDFYERSTRAAKA